MIKSKHWTTIVESLVVMLIIVVWVVWTYKIFTNSQKLSDSTAYRLAAISMAREWIEVITNIRDTNWLLFWSNTTNCWLTFNYNSSCITAGWTTTNIPTWSYKIYKNSNNRWYLSWPIATWNYSDSTYRDNFRVNLDSDWFYTQSGWTNFLPIFTREIKIYYPSDAWTPPQSVNVESIVRWSDSSRTNWNFEVKLQTLLTNWKKD
jgi:hypothetical protein